MTTTYENKVEILAEFWTFYSTDGEWVDWFEVHDIGVNLATLISLGHATPTDSGVEWINEDFREMCELLGVDPYGDYDSLDRMFAIAAVEG